MPTVSARQHRAMEAAAHGHSTLGIPKKVGEEFVAADATNGNAAGVLFVAPDGDVLLMRRSADEENYGGWWGLPGGKAENGEQPLAAARREVKEETGFDCSTLPLKVFDSVVTPNKMAFHTYACGVDEKFAPKMADGEHQGAAWFSLDGLPAKTHPSIVRAIKERLSLGDDMQPEDWEGLRSGFAKWTREEEQEPEHAGDDAHGKLNEKERQEADRDHASREEMPASAFLEPASRKYPVKEKVDGDWKYDSDLLLAAAREARMHGHHDLAERADAIRKRMDGQAHDAAIAFDRKTARSYDGDGRLHLASSHISKANVCEYLGNEIPDFEKLGLDPHRLYKLYRHPGELKKAEATFNNLPILSKHVPVDALNHHPELVIGSTGTDGKFKDDYLDNSLVFWAKPAIDDIEDDTKKELSSAYRYRADMTPGKTPDGDEYDGVMRDIAGNHVALVKEGRAGPDVVVGDTKETINMAKVKMTRTGAAVRSVIALHIAPRLAQDAKLDLRPILAKLTSKNFAAQKGQVLSAIKTAARGKLARDASLDDVTGLLDHLEKAPIDKGDEEIEVPPSEEESMDSAEEDEIMKFLKEKLGKDDFEEARERLRAHDRRAHDRAHDETDEEKEEREKREKKERDEKLAGDVEEAVKERTKDMVDKKGMDAAIDAAVKLERKRAQDIADAREEVRPMVGTLKQAFDSAEGVYQGALSVLGVTDTDKITGVPALKAVLNAQRQSAQPRKNPVTAMDSASAKSLAERFPHAAKIKVNA